MHFLEDFIYANFDIFLKQFEATDSKYSLSFATSKVVLKLWRKKRTQSSENLKLTTNIK